MILYMLFGVQEVPQASTGFTLFKLLFGQPQELLDVEGLSTQNAFITPLVHSGAITLETLGASAEEDAIQASDQDLSSGASPVGLSASERGGPSNLCPYWENKVHSVVETMGDGPVYRIKAEISDCTLSVLHRNLLLPVNDLPLEHDGQENQIQKQQRQKQHCMNSRYQMSDTLKHEASDSGDKE